MSHSDHDEGSQVDGTVDLAGFARSEPSVETPRRHWLRIVVPLAILGAFAFVLRDTLRELWTERTRVSIVRPVRLAGAMSAGTSNGEGAGVPRVGRTLAVQAAGWVEPDPFPVLVPALSGGVLQSVRVEEADRVTNGEVIATLVPDDARVAHAEAEAHLAFARARAEVARVRSEIAVDVYAEALDVNEAVATARAQVRGREAEAALRAVAVEEGAARVSLAESEVAVQKELDAAGAAGVRQVEIAEAEFAVAEARLKSLEAEVELATSRVLEARAALTRASEEERLRFDDRLRRDEMAARLLEAEAEVRSAEARLATASLRLERVEIPATTDGVVLERLAVAGDVLAAGQAVASLYRPDELRIRVDVPQGDVWAVRVGQTAEILADVRPDQPYTGEVLRIVERADIQKVTLEAQVRVLDGDGLLRPDMLTQVRFFNEGGGAESTGGQGGGAAPDATIQLRLSLPRAAVEGGFAWILDPLTSEARRVTVEVGGSTVQESGGGASGSAVEVRGGVNLTDKVVLDGRDELEALRLSRGGVDRLPVRLRSAGSSGSSESSDQR